MKFLMLFSFLFFFSHPLTFDQNQNFLTVWNVGQGQWITWVKNNHCYHFDMGGEKMDWNKLKQLCSNKKNEVFFTHSDSDHTHFYYKGKKILRNLCTQKLPQTKNKKKFFPHCQTSWPEKIKWYSPSDFINQNESSTVFLINEQILIPGDSTKKMEAQWLKYFNLHSVHTLIAGHHGSNTSTGSLLLKHLPQLQLVIASARSQKYGHPHPKVVSRLWQNLTPLLSTEEWGHISLGL